MEIAKLNEQRGEFVFRNAIGLLIGAMLLSVGLSIFSVYHIINGVREKTNESVLAVASVNVAEFYGGARESDGFARHYFRDQVTCFIDTEDVMTTLASAVNATYFTDTSITVGTSYKLTDISTRFVNYSGGYLNFETTLTVTVPLDLGNVNVPISKRITVRSSYDAKF